MVEVVKEMGFTGFGRVDDIQVLLTAGSLSEDHSIVYMQPLSLPKPSGAAGGAQRGRTKYASGTHLVNGSLSFDLTWSALGLMKPDRLLRRGYQFKVIVSDGENTYECKKCYATSIGLSGSVGGIISATLSFIHGKEWTIGSSKGIKFSRENEMIGYWASGNTNVRDWSLTWNQAIEPMYLNGLNDEDDRWPRYLKVGMVDASLDVTTMDRIYRHDTITIGTTTFSIHGDTQSFGYSFNGSADVGTYSHSFASGPDLTDGSGAVILTGAE